MAGHTQVCPKCGCRNLDPRTIWIGRLGISGPDPQAREITTLKCQRCGWLGEMQAGPVDNSQSA